MKKGREHLLMDNICEQEEFIKSSLFIKKRQEKCFKFRNGVNSLLSPDYMFKTGLLEFMYKTEFYVFLTLVRLAGFQFFNDLLYSVILMCLIIVKKLVF